MKLKEIIRNIIRILRAMSGKNRFLLGFVVIVLILALIRVANPSVAEDNAAQQAKASPSNGASRSDTTQIPDAGISVDAAPVQALDSAAKGNSIFFDKGGKEVKHRIFSRERWSMWAVIRSFMLTNLTAVSHISFHVHRYCYRI